MIGSNLSELVQGFTDKSFRSRVEHAQKSYLVLQVTSGAPVCHIIRVALSDRFLHFLDNNYKFLNLTFLIPKLIQELYARL